MISGVIGLFFFSLAGLFVLALLVGPTLPDDFADPRDPQFLSDNGNFGSGGARSEHPWESEFPIAGRNTDAIPLPAPPTDQLSGVKLNFVSQGTFLRAEVRLALPGSADEQAFVIYYPGSTRPEPGSLSCVLLAPRGEKGIFGADAIVDEADALAFVEAGYAVVAFSVDGATTNLAPPAERAEAYRKFVNANLGLNNCQNALYFVRNSLAEVDPTRIFIAGRDAGGSLALLYATHEPALRGCVSFDAYVFADAIHGALYSDDRHFIYPGIDHLNSRQSPLTHAHRLQCPTLLWASEDGTADALDFSNLGRDNGQDLDVVEEVPPRANRSVNAAIPSALNWLLTHGGRPFPPSGPEVPSATEYLEPAPHWLPRESSPNRLPQPQ